MERHNALQSRFSERGQAMLIVTIFVGAVVALVTVVAGFLTLQQVRSSAGIAASARAIFAADAGLEWGLCAIINPNIADPSGGCLRMSPHPDPDVCPASPPTFRRGTTANVRLTCSGGQAERITATGRSGNAIRVLELQIIGP